jgi:hypothetical protein
MIKFGTSGWRAIIADEFTYANVQRAVAGISRYVAAHAAGRPPRLIIGYDPRFLGPQFAEFSAQIASSHGIHVLLCQEPAPTPAIAFQVQALKTDRPINFTASSQGGLVAPLDRLKRIYTICVETAPVWSGFEGVATLLYNAIPVLPQAVSTGRIDIRQKQPFPPVMARASESLHSPELSISPSSAS